MKFDEKIAKFHKTNVSAYLIVKHRAIIIETCRMIEYESHHYEIDKKLFIN